MTRHALPSKAVWVAELALAILAFAVLTVGAPARAASGAWASSEHVSVRLLSAVDGTGDLATVTGGLEVKLEGDWKTYWRSPGDAGLPPMLDWAGSTNLAKATLRYPAPQRVSVLGIQTFGYKHDVVFPLDLAVADKGRPLDLKLHLDLLVCAEQCVPKSFDLALAIPAGPATPDSDAQVLAKARAAVPGDVRASGMRVVTAQEVSDAGKPALEVTATADPPFVAPDLIAELMPDANLGTPRVTLSVDRRQATFDVPLSKRLPVGASLTGRRAILTLTDGPRALEQTVTLTQGASALEEEPGPSLVAMLGLALLGGLILNLMPCVLPVLSMKVFTVVSQGGRAPAAVRAGFLASAAGIIVSFLVIAGILIGVKAAGHAIGWGLQFQEPAFIAALTVVVSFFAAHLAGFVEVPLPRFIARAAEGRAGPDETLAGHFLTGAFATLLATPCSAPFLGTAVGFALSGSASGMVAIFFALGVGLAMPYLVVAAMPQLATRLPRPGRWMERLKQALAIPLVLTAFWLVGILAAQAGVGAAASVAGLLVALVGLLALRRRLPRTVQGLVVPVVALVALGAVVLPDVIAARGGAHGVEDDGTIAWRGFDRDEIRSLVSQGRTVFVDVTADWCLTCQANKRFVLSKDAIAQRLNSQAVAMQADWTRPDPQIGAYLASYGRYGIPFNIVYGPGAPGGIVLPELLTTGDVAAALNKASGTKAELAPTTPRDVAADEGKLH